MKYMGSKQYMLKNGLSDLLSQEVPKSKRFIDPFAGSCAVVRHVALNYSVEIITSDLQLYSEVIAKSITGRTEKIDLEKLNRDWILKARKSCKNSRHFIPATILERSPVDTVILVKKARVLCRKKSGIGPIWNAYGGHYFSPSQAIGIDYLMKYLPLEECERSLCLSALIQAASKIASAPGHTAQPLQPKDSGNVNNLIVQAWKRDLFDQVKKELEVINQEHGQKLGSSYTLEANETLKDVREGDLVFLDPPYSGVQYSRFYHVLETIARGECGPVEGVGRYPSLSDRPQSKFSNVGQSEEALNSMMKLLSERGAKVIFTFLEGDCSNGLSGDFVKKVSKKYFNIDEERGHVHGFFSTMGGNNRNRPSKIESVELLLLLTPKLKKQRTIASPKQVRSLSNELIPMTL